MPVGVVIRSNAIKSFPIRFIYCISKTYQSYSTAPCNTSEHEVQRLIRQLDLNSPRLKKWRILWIRIVELAEAYEPPLHSMLVGFPEDLPDLKRLRPPHNSRSIGIVESWFAKREDGRLPDEY